MNAPRRRPPTTALTPIPAFAPVLRLEGGDGGVDGEGVGDVMGVEGEDSGTIDVVADIVRDDDVIGVVVDVGRLMVVDAAEPIDLTNSSSRFVCSAERVMVC